MGIEETNLKEFTVADPIATAFMFCEKYGIKNRMIHKDGTIDVTEGDVDIRNFNGEELPVKFGKVKDNFYCGCTVLLHEDTGAKHDEIVGMNLTTLKGMPNSVGGDFDCSCSKITSLEGAPQTIGGNFNCSRTSITSLKGAPQVVGGFGCAELNLESFEGAPQTITTDGFSCANANIPSLVGLPKKIKGPFSILDVSLASLKGCPEEVDGDVYICGTNITSLTGLPKVINGQLTILRNPITNLCILDLYNIKGLSGIRYDDGAIDKIVNRHLPSGPVSVLLAQDELIDAGFGLIARFSHPSTV